MSIWTHACGYIRVDAIRFNKYDSYKLKKKISENLGNIIDGLSERNENTYIPCGTEGSLEWKIDITPDLSRMNAAGISIWGDLRDYVLNDNLIEIELYLSKIIKGLSIRDGIISFSSGYESDIKIVYLYKDTDCDKCQKDWQTCDNDQCGYWEKIYSCVGVNGELYR